VKWALALIASVAGCGLGTDVPEQPLPFSHAVHVGRHAIACVDCHAGAARGVEAGLPPIGACLRCHMQPQGDPASGRDEVVRRRAAEGGQFRWVQVTRNPGHVYFSHRAHVTFADMPCTDCHGDVATWAEPPRSVARDLVDMDACMDCHRERGASNECQTCHR